MKNRFVRRDFVLKSSSLAFIAIVLIGGLLFTSCSGSPEDTLKKIASETQAGLPQVMDEYTTMTGCTFLPDRTLKFTYAIKGLEYSPAQKNEMEQAMKSVLIDRLKGRKELEFYLVNNVRFEHIFLDSAPKEVLHINIEALDYK